MPLSSLVAERRALERILSAPEMALVVPQLPPETLHRVIQACGLEDCGDLVALVTPEQLTHLLDLDLWRAERPGLNEELDAARFGRWLEVLVDAGPAQAARQLAELDVDLVIAGLTQHVLVSDRAAIAEYETTDGDRIPGAHSKDVLTADVGGYVIIARRADAWDAIVEVLRSLEAEQREYFLQIMRGTRALSNSRPETDGLDDLLTHADQAMFDVSIDRERRRERQGYVAAGDARAFLQMSRQFRVEAGAASLADPVARAYFRALRDVRDAEGVGSGAKELAARGAAPAGDVAAQSIAAVIDVLREAGIVEPPPRALLAGSQTQPRRLGSIQAQMEFLFARDPVAYAARTEEIAFLANTIMAGCSIQERSLTAEEASTAAVATCNLGLETLAPGIGFLVEHDLIGVFQAGWTVLHDDVAMYAAERLADILKEVRCPDREIQTGLSALRRELVRHLRAGMPWRARDAMDVLASLDMPAWVALLGLIGECPVVHAAVAASQDSSERAVSASAFEFISEQVQIVAVQAFMQSLRENLRG